MSRVNAAGSAPVSQDLSDPEPEAPAAGPTPTPAANVIPYSAEQASKEVQPALTRSTFDWVISDSDVERVHDALERLSPGEYRKAISEMSRGSPSALDRYVANLSPEACDRFVRQAIARGVMKEVGGKPESPSKDPTGKPYSPPSLPTTADVERGAPEALKEAARAYNGRVRSDYETAYQGYVDRYAAAVDQARSPAALRQIGEPVYPHGFREFGQTRQGDHRAALLWHAKFDELTDRARSGLVAQSNTAASVDAGPLKLKGEETVDFLPRGRIARSSSEGVELTAKVDGSPVFAGTDSKGNFRLGFDAGGFEAKLKLARGGTLELEASVPNPITTSVAKTSVGVKVVADVPRRTMLAGVTAEGKLGPLRAEQDLMVGFRGAQEGTGGRAVSADPDLIHNPPELSDGTRWEALEPARRKQLSAKYSAQSWDAALAARDGTARR